MPPPSIARSFFDQIRTAPDPVVFIRGLINSTPPTYETDWLDFKQPPNTNLKEPKWREMWVEALAGFANNQGGVIIWRIDARKDPATNLDAACGERPVDNPNGVRSRLIELQRQATDPPLGNVEIEAYEISSSPDTGFVVCLGPEGPFKPYRAEDGRRSQYPVRAGDNFVVMSRPMLQAMFYPRLLAVFRVRADLSWKLLDRKAVGGKNVARMDCIMNLVNDGTATASDLLVTVQHTVKENIGDITWASTVWETYSTTTGMEFFASRPMHPGRVSRLFYAKWEVEARSSPATNYQVVPYCPPLTVDLAFFCDNHERQAIKVEFDMGKLIADHRCLVEAMPVG